MQRVLYTTALLLLAAGCQTQNPFAAIGPATVPAPTTGQTLPYYPPTVTGTPPGTPTAAGTATSKPPGRVSVSAEGAASISTPRTAIVADPADREPIRIVENGDSAVRTANAASRGATPTGNSPPGIPATPAGTAPGGSATPSGPATPPANRIPPSTQSGYSTPAIPATSPAISRMRGFTAAQPATSSSSAGSARTVAPASYQQAVPTFSEATPADGQWRAR